MNAGALCNREVIVAFARDTVLDAAKLMRQHHVGSLVIVEPDELGRRPIGVLTDRDIVVSVLAKEICDLASLSVGDVMSAAVVTCSEEDSIEKVITTMQRHGVRRVPVVDAKGYLVGIAALDDLISIMAERIEDLNRVAARERSNELTYRP